MNKAKYLLATIGTSIATMAFIPEAHAAVISSFAPTGSVNSSGTTGSLTNLIGTVGQTIINIILALATIVAIIYLIYAGVQYVTAGGDADKAKKARGGIINAVIGIIVIVAAYSIINFAVSLGGAASTTTNNAANGTVVQ